MHNAHRPNLDDLPTARQLWRSTAIAAGAAALILVTVVWPSEYGIDPTGIGGALGLAEMGEIKIQLAEEAEADRLMMEGNVEPQSSLQPGLLDVIFGAMVGTAHAQEAPAEAAAWTEEITFALAPGQGIEIKLVMEESAVASFEWAVEGGEVNFDLHGDGPGNSISYEKGRAVPGAAGELTAAFTGNHGWFWRNRGDAAVNVTLRVAGAYSEIKRFD
ncbi:transmembrane anchor protein [Frigidibacter sp.]|uniref:transmembrane anchor protein n=1 Tax=Frigidibacter sp. TaxID=2586418 RepID=UPI0027357193|nr:transmembrane anchor protein [Frigidibacter sp.]MDP3342331.1 transmembrane anchor protein [Frigidibacter sp.]